ncbi:catechol 2,3-dioxygenase [Fictibacillus solisalsi]|uniref:Catechol 2,3-dioxygenase n=1 Tax=Fictibacillus solisalsi TaxID=459525 RepID=A0A1G9VDW6_9BACL|nr:VOC family protein [Fictibacillus solisalsi]SDM70237.1 catechol 2,3-dioxygenase [Fictibacillus solisalsi]
MNFHTAPQTFVQQVHLIVKDLDRSLSFYDDILGFSILNRKDNKVELTLDGTSTILTIEQPQNAQPKQPRTAGLYHFALLVPTRKELAKVLRHLLNIGYPLQGASDHLVSEALYLADPDGNGIEIYRDRDSGDWQWNNGQVVMTTEPLDAEGLLAESMGMVFEGLPPETIMGHLHLHVSHLEEAEAFYCKGLGFEVVQRLGNQALFISTGKYHHHLGLNIWNGKGAPAPASNAVGIDEFLVVYPTNEARKEAVIRLETLGFVSTQTETDFYLTDPSGTKMKLAVEYQ